MKQPIRHLASLLFLICISGTVTAQDLFSARDLLELKSIRAVQINPQGDEIIYAIATPRGPNDAPGGARISYYRASIYDRVPIPLFKADEQGSSPQYSPDGQYIGFLWAKEGETRQVWLMETIGGNMKRLTNQPAGISFFRWQPGENGIAYLSPSPATGKKPELKKRGYGFIFYEENIRKNNLYLAKFDAQWNPVSEWQLTSTGQTWNFEFDRPGTRIAATISPKNLIDHWYMFRKIYLIDIKTGDMRQISENEGKLGNYAFSPDGTHLAYTAALNRNDHKESQVYVVNLGTGEVTNLTPEGFRGHITRADWKDNNHLLCYSGEGVYPKLSIIPKQGGEREIVLDASENGIIFSAPIFTDDFKHIVFTGSTPTDPVNLYLWDGKGEPEKVSNINPRIRNKTLGHQEVIRYRARDGREIEGIMIYPVGYDPQQKYPLIVYVHGGPESHHSNGWLSRYSTPGQVMAGKGYLVLYPNYRASTGYGVDFAMQGFMDPAGREFDDIADGIDWAVREKGADPERVGMAGGSYGGYASGWFATYYTRYVKAVCMFVGISNIISKRGTTDIPYEELYVHSGKRLEEQWQLDLERSPVYWAHQSRTATLIYGGTADTRVSPSQSIELYRRMKMNGHPAVRLVQYPGEGHGNRKQTGQIDVLYRQMEWLDWYVRDLHPLDGPMPRLDISDRYGLDWD